ncbi:hypothetical protein C8R41DRAFT_839596, partial [Lentinula lateritia]
QLFRSGKTQHFSVDPNVKIYSTSGRAGIHTREDHSVDPDEVDLGLDSIFIEVPRPPSPEAMFSIFQGSHKEFRSRPVGSHPLWGHHLWNSVLLIAS